PPANLFDFSFLAPCPSSGLVVQGGADDIVPEASVAKLVNKLSGQRNITVDYHLIPTADHFFSTYLADMTLAVSKYLALRVGQKP
ncbi:MAG: alpha/beta hydrolase, partial [Rhodospirillaceae bacterium]|nr:alpha/beta hydrolase [Rhodospirillaceae bacterium]